MDENELTLPLCRTCFEPLEFRMEPGRRTMTCPRCGERVVGSAGG